MLEPSTSIKIGASVLTAISIYQLKEDAFLNGTNPSQKD